MLYYEYKMLHLSIYEGHVKDKGKDELSNEINCCIKCNQKEVTNIKTVVLLYHRHNCNRET